MQEAANEPLLANRALSPQSLIKTKNWLSGIKVQLLILDL